MDPIELDVADRTQFFVDDTVLADSRGLTRRFHPLKKKMAPVVEVTEPWEGPYLIPAAVLQDGPGGTWRMWCANNGTRGVPGAGNGVTIVLHSKDGERWEKNPLGAFALPDGRPTIIASFPDGAPAPAPCAVFADPDEPDASRRYKMMYYRPNYHLAYSPDGIRWRPAQPEPVWRNGAGDGLEETFFFMRDRLADEYRGYMRVWRRHQTIRKTALGSSPDLVHWNGPAITWEAVPEWGIGAQIYGMNVWTDGGLYWALPWVSYTDEPLDPAIRQTIRLKAAWSRDGRTWQALFPAEDAVAMGEPGAFDAGLIYSVCPMVEAGDRLRLYYAGRAGRHDGTDTHSAVGMAEMRKGGFVSLRADGEGVLITHRFLMRGNELRVNARAEPGGAVTAELLSDGGGVMRKFSAERSDPFCGDATDHTLTWAGNGDLGFLRGQHVRLRLLLRQAEVFSFRVSGPPELIGAPIGPAPVRCGRCAVPPVVDGRLDDACWEDFDHTGTAMEFVRFAEPQPAPVKTRVRFTHDGSTLYMAAECDEPDWEKVPKVPAGPSVHYMRDEVLEIRLSAPEHGHYCHQLFVTVHGLVQHNWFSKEGGGGRGISPVAWTAKAASIPGRWTAELAVPFAVLEAAAPKAGDRWRLNILRHRHAAGDDVSCWSCMFGSVHRNDLAGDLVFV